MVDGGMGTLLQDKGLDDGGSGELWNVERPDVVREAHRDYAEAGARILTTNTFGGTARGSTCTASATGSTSSTRPRRGWRARSPTSTARWSPVTSARPVS